MHLSVETGCRWKSQLQNRSGWSSIDRCGLWKDASLRLTMSGVARILCCPIVALPERYDGVGNIVWQVADVQQVK